jgi:hypothetical protein
MRKTVWIFSGLFGLAAAPALAADGDSLAPEAEQVAWARWQGRLSLGSGAPASRLGMSQLLPSATLMGDYYFGRSLAGPGSVGGFRATSGLIFGPRASLATGQPGLSAGSSFSIGSRLFGQNAMPYGSDMTGDSATLPYLGMGYTGLAAHGGWSFSADLGLVSQTPGGIKLIRSQSLDEAVHEMRLAPLLQLGVSYAF